MTDFTVHWLHPWLGLLTAAAIVALWLGSRYRRHITGSLRDYFTAVNLKELITGHASARSQVLFFIAAGLLSVAVAGPFLMSDHSGRETETSGYDLVAVVDLSPSMLAPDLTPSRLVRAKLALRDLSRRFHRHRLGLVVFSANAYPVLPLSSDTTLFDRYVDALDVSLIARRGSYIGGALEEAHRMLAQSPADSRAIIVLSDGEFHDPELPAADTLRIPVYPVAVGTSAGGPVPDRQGRLLRDRNDEPVITRLNLTSLRHLADASGGRLLRLTAQPSPWPRLETLLDQQLTRHPLASDARLHIPLYTGLIAGALALFLWQGWRQFRLYAGVALVVSLSCPAESSVAGEPLARQAQAALQQGDFNRAEQLYGQVPGYTGWMGQGAAAFRQGRFRDAAARFRQAIDSARHDTDAARAWYNLGTTLIYLGERPEARQALRQALRLQPNYPRARRNLNALEQSEAVTLFQSGPASANALPPPTAGNAGAKPEPSGRDPETAGQGRSSRAADTTPTRQKTRHRLQGGGPTSEQLRVLLRRRFARIDRLNGLVKAETRPW